MYFFNNQPIKCQHKDNYITCVWCQRHPISCAVSLPAPYKRPPSLPQVHPSHSNYSEPQVKILLLLRNTPVTNQNFLCVHYTQILYCLRIWVCVCVFVLVDFLAVSTDTEITITSRSWLMKREVEESRRNHYLTSVCAGVHVRSLETDDLSSEEEKIE